MQRDTSLDTPNSKVYGTRRVYDTTGAVERKATIADADDQLEAAKEAASNAVARAVEAAEEVKEVKQEQARAVEQEAKAAADAKKLDAKKEKAKAKAALAVEAAVNEVVGGDPVVDADHEVAGPEVGDEVTAADKPAVVKKAVKKKE